MKNDLTMLKEVHTVQNHVNMKDMEDGEKKKKNPSVRIVVRNLHTTHHGIGNIAHNNVI